MGEQEDTELQLDEVNVLANFLSCVPQPAHEDLLHQHI